MEKKSGNSKIEKIRPLNSKVSINWKLFIWSGIYRGYSNVFVEYGFYFIE